MPVTESLRRLAEKADSLSTVRKSGIHGRGLFAASRIREDSLIGIYDGPESKRDGNYVLWIEREDGSEYGIAGKNKMRFVNHSREANACFFDEELIALRTIEPGEEITHDYGW